MAILTNSGGAQLLDNSNRSLIFDTGSIVQFASGTSSSQNITNSTTFTDSTLFVDITPKSATNKILIHANFFRRNEVCLANGSPPGANENGIEGTGFDIPDADFKVATDAFAIKRTVLNSGNYVDTQLPTESFSSGAVNGFGGSSSSDRRYGEDATYKDDTFSMLTAMELLYLDSPNTTVLTRYRVMHRTDFKDANNSQPGRSAMVTGSGGASRIATITAMEIAF
jgi:hypothetical protein